MQELINLYDEWFNNKDWWFSKNSKIDVYLCDKYYNYIEDAYNIYEEYCKDINKHKNKLIIACIILLDQITRHYKRVYDDKLDIVKYTKIAVNISNILLYRNNYMNFSIDELSFIYLPYRHMKDIDKIYEIIYNYIQLYNESDSDDKIKCRRYIQATLNNIYKDINILSMKNTLPAKNWEDINKEILDPKSCKSNYTSSVDNIIYTSVLEQFENIKEDSTIIVSLSGGVDSMVGLYICKYIKDMNDTYNSTKIKNIIAVHINYNNRETSTDELHFVNYYCNKLGIKLYFRTICELKRNDCLHNGLRDLYEDITKNIRYDMYRQNIKNDRTYVLLGHNKDDCFENILTNISNKCNYDNLSGMQILKEIDGIMMWRPMLNIEKKHIIEYANINKIPYLYDSTPEWSVRGKIRDKIKPAFLKLKNNEEREEDGIIDSFFDLKDYIANTQNIFTELIIKNLVSKLILIYDNIEDNQYRAFYSRDELLSLQYMPICELFFKKLKIKCSYKALKDFSKYISNYRDRSFVLSKLCIINIKTDINYNNSIYANFTIINKL
jgi:tRNA(Ile)-lysidine synthetase-like protein